MFLSLIYVSRSLIPAGTRQAEIDALVADAVERNQRLGVRGALLFTEAHFAQLLEGPEAAIDEVMDSILRDHRHERVTVIERRPIDGYRFPDWGLAYWGDASYMDRKIAIVLEKHEALVGESEGTTELYDLIWLLAQQSRDQDGPIGRPSPEG